ncbi:uncharacterized [Tachysurus ichikawai]
MAVSRRDAFVRHAVLYRYLQAKSSDPLLHICLLQNKVKAHDYFTDNDVAYRYKARCLACRRSNPIN